MKPYKLLIIENRYHIRKLKSTSLFILITFLSSFILTSEAQTADIDSLFQRFKTLYNIGDYINAEKILVSILGSEEKLEEDELIAAYNNLGVVSQMLGKYDRAIGFYKQSETLGVSENQSLKDLAAIYSNKGLIYDIKKSYDLSIEHYEKSIRIYNSLNIRDENILRDLSSAFLNIGITFLNIDKNTTAMEFFNRSLEIKLRYNFPGLELVYLNIAKAWVKLNNAEQAEKFYINSIDRFINEFDENYIRLAEVYFDYGLFLRSEGRNSEALEVHRKALSICLDKFGEKHSFVALSYKHIGDHYFIQSDYLTALNYYQKSLISVVNDFNNPDIYSNPSIDSSLLDIRLLDNLKSKAEALEQYALEQDERNVKLKILDKSLENVEVAIQLIDRMRISYPTEDSRIYLSENEKETYLFALHIASTLYSLTGEVSMVGRMYSIAMKAKASILRNDITENELLYSSLISDSIREKRNSLAGNIAAYNNLILEEYGNANSDSSKISFWKDAIFEMNRQLEKITNEINRTYPQYYDLLRKTEPVPITVIQRNLHRNETVVDYVLSNEYQNGKRNLHIFMITRKNLEFYQTSLDSSFLTNAEIIRNINSTSVNRIFRDYTSALNYMYVNLIKPIEELFAGRKLIIIPDEEICWLPFDAFLITNPKPDQTDYEGLQYLINNYTISYCYSSSTITGKKDNIRGKKVFAFSPDYSDTSLSPVTADRLKGSSQEIESIYRWFRGKKFMGDQATETNFKKVIGNPAIFHLAMHLISDTINSKYSYLLFDSRSDDIADGKLYNYEISLTRVKSPMVVLSACNSGTGTLYQGEGLMSLARGFILAGASSVIRTAWEVNDETSAKIISRFYYYLSRGKDKDVAMRQAKLDYLNGSPPAFTSPYFWAAYEVMCDNRPVAYNYTILLLIIGSSLIIAFSILFLYFKWRRRIFSDRSL